MEELLLPLLMSRTTAHVGITYVRQEANLSLLRHIYSSEVRAQLRVMHYRSIYVLVVRRTASAGPVQRGKKKKNVTHEPINPVTLYYDGSTKARWVQKAKLQNT